MTTELATKSYERLDGYIDRIINSLQKSGEIIQEYLNVAKEEGIEEQEAWKYLKGKIPKTTFYRYLPDMYKSGTGRPKKEFPIGKLGETNKEEFNTEGMGVIIPEPESSSESATGPDGQEVEQETSNVESNDEHDRLIAKIQELEKTVSDVSFQKASETPQAVVAPPAQQIIILPHNMVLDVYQKRMGVGLEGFMQLRTENNIVVGVEIVNVTQTKQE